MWGASCTGSRGWEPWLWGAGDCGMKVEVAFIFLRGISQALDTFSISSPPRPDLLDFESLKKCNAHYNLQNAFNLAEKELGLTKLLDPEGEAELWKREAVG